MPAVAAFTALILLGILAGTSTPSAPVHAEPADRQFTLIPSLPLQLGIANTATPTRTPTPINIGNFVWDDYDSDGRQDAGEPGLSGITVQLWNSTKTTMFDDAVTDGNGHYTVVAPLPGSYRIRVLLPSGSDQFSPKDQAGGDDTDDSDINPGGSSAGFTDIISIANNVISMTNVDAGIIKFRTATPTRTPTPINIGNLVWDDYDSDGRQDAGEPGLSGIIVQLWNSAKTTMFDDAVTDGNGHYTVVAPLPGSYRIRVVLPGASDQFSPKDQAGGDDTNDSDINPTGSNSGFTDVIAIASNVISMTNIDAGIIKFRTATPTRTPTPINLGNLVWNDLDHDGQQDAGEAGLAGVTVQLWNSAKTLMIDDAVTNGNGNYTLIAPIPGSYRIRVVLPSASDQFSPKDQAGGDDTDDSDINPIGSNSGFTDVIVIANNVISISNLDAGIIRTITATPTLTPTATYTLPPAVAVGTIGNFVWNDLDHDGVQDAGEPGLSGLTVQLWNTTKTTMIATTTTNALGQYTITAVPGDYRIRVLLADDDDEFSPTDQGSDTFDSDIINGQPSPSNPDAGYKASSRCPARKPW
ncbi:MAG: SdrD B-like domain-containing protein [Anaerolineae bacterium]